MDLSVVIACKDRDMNIRYCINSIANNIKVPKVILVDFGSRNPVEFKEFDFVRTIRVDRDTKFFHKARALNIGIKRVHTKFLCITDADQVFSRKFFSTVYKVLNRYKKILVMCKTYFLRSMPEDVTTTNLKQKYSKLVKLAKNSGIVMHGDGCCNGLLTSRARLLRGYDEQYRGYGGEDSDFKLRASLSGLAVKWIHQHQDVTMVHLPHPKKGKYYCKTVFARNKKRYIEKVKSKDIYANTKRSWGMV